MNTKCWCLLIVAITVMGIFGGQSSAQQQPKLERVEQLPTGAQISVLGTFFSTENKAEFVFDAPLHRVWMAVKKTARDFDKDSRRAVVAIDEQTNRVQNGKIDQMSMATAGAWGPFVDEFVTEATRVSDMRTKVTIIRTVMQRETMNRWGPQKSNGKIEQYLLTQIADNLKNLPATELGTGPTNPPNSSTTTPQLTNNQVIRMVSAKLPDEIIIATIKGSAPMFDLAPDELIKLKEAGVSDAVLRVMMEARPR